MSIRVGIVGVRGYGGGEALRLCAAHPGVRGRSTSPANRPPGPGWSRTLPGSSAKLAELVIQKWDPAALPKLDVLFASLPTGESKEALARSPRSRRRSSTSAATTATSRAGPTASPTCGRTRSAASSRIANPGCYPAGDARRARPAAGGEADRARTASSSTPRAASAAPAAAAATRRFGYRRGQRGRRAPTACSSTPTCRRWSARSRGWPAGRAAGLVFTPHLIPMTRGILATIYARGKATTEQCLAAAASLLCGPPLRARDRGAAAHEVGDGLQPRLRLLRRRPGAESRHRARARSTTSAKAPPGQALQNANLDHRPARDGRPRRRGALAVSARPPLSASRC